MQTDVYGVVLEYNNYRLPVKNNQNEKKNENKKPTEIFFIIIFLHARIF